MADPRDFSSSLLRLQNKAPNPLGQRVLWLLLAFLGALLVWAIFGKLEIVAVAEGKLIPASHVKIVQPAEAGIVRDILVKEAESVKAGRVLMRMDTLIAQADANALQADAHRMRLSIRRIDAELGGTVFAIERDDPLALAGEIQAQHKVNRLALETALAEEQARLNKARQELAAASQVRQKLEATLPHFRQQEKAYEKLVSDGFVAALVASDKKRERLEKEQELQTQEHLIASAQASVTQSHKRLAQIAAEVRQKLHAERNGLASQLDKLTQEIAKQTHRQALMELKAPQDGIVKDLATHTAGTVVQPGTVLLSLVPTHDKLKVEAWVANEDVGFVRPGQDVKLKFAAYPFQKYGMAQGTVESVSPDAADPNAQGSNPNPATDSKGNPRVMRYKAIINLKSTQLHAHGESFALGVGMQADTEIVLGTRSVLAYLLSPAQKAWHEAGRER